MAIHTKMRQQVRTWSMPQGRLCDPGAVSADICALVMKEVVMDSQQAPLRVHRGADAMALLTRMIGRNHVTHGGLPAT
jgi:hypothetical protein